MLDVVITGGLVVDGSGGPGRRADVGISDGRVVQLAATGTITDSAARRVDADGLIVAPGFIDVHTHQDAQVFWDPALHPFAAARRDDRGRGELRILHRAP